MLLDSFRSVVIDISAENQADKEEAPDDPISHPISL